MRALALLTAVLLTTVARAGDTPAADEVRLADHPRWQALLHINRGGTLRDRGASYVDDDSFFLAEDGKQDAAAELAATRAALAPPDSEARCRFPARYRFLARHLGWDEAEPLAHCEQYQRWRGEMHTGQLVLVFPAAYLNSPSSMFGHTLLRLDPEPDPDSVWLSHAINFGAQVNPDDNSLFYIWRGLAGGYPGRFSIVSYLDKIQEYAHLENRDMWEYALDLDGDALDWVVRHLWELRDINFDYFFFDENCSYRLLELIQVGRPEATLMEELRFAEVPVKTVRTLERAGLIAERRYRPSKAVELDHLAQQLEPAERRLARRLQHDPDLAENAAFQDYPPERRHLMARTAYQALRFHNRKRARDETVAAHSFELLRLVREYPAPELPAIAEPAAPETGHRTQMMRIGGGRYENADFGELGWRLTYHDVLDPLTGFLPGAGIEGLDVRLRSTDSGPLTLESLDLVNIRSLSPRGTFVKPVSWFVHAGYERARAGSRRRPVRFVKGGPGLSWSVGRFMPYGFLVARAENASSWTPAIETGAGGELGVLYHAAGIQAGLSAGEVHFENDFYRRTIRATLNVPVSRNNALRTSCERRGWRGGHEDECRVEWRHYFD